MFPPFLGFGTTHFYFEADISFPSGLGNPKAPETPEKQGVWGSFHKKSQLSPAFFTVRRFPA